MFLFRFLLIQLLYLVARIRAEMAEYVSRLALVMTVSVHQGLLDLTVKVIS